MKTICCGLFFLAGLGFAAAEPLPACFPQGGFNVESALPQGARELKLKSGDTLVLNGIDVPDSLASRTQARLAELGSQPLRYVPLLTAPDRYGRIPADIAFGVPQQWLQGVLVGEGLALASPGGISGNCMKELLFVEAQARQKKTGLWAQPGGIILQATDLPALTQAQGQFRVVEGKILNVGKRDYATFLNFGPAYTHDFAVIILKKNRDAVEAATPLAGLAGRKVRVRGIIKTGLPPRITLDGSNALEIL